MSQGRERVGSRLRRAAAVVAAAAWLHGGFAVGHESYRQRSAALERPGIAAADEAQSRHDFAGARRQLDRLLAANPRDLEARLMSANLFLLAGDFERARNDCRLVIEIGALQAGTVCLASALTGPGSLDRGRRMIAALGDVTDGDVELARWRLLTEADLALRAGDFTAGLALHERAHALDTSHEEARTRLAGLLLERGEVARAYALAQAPDPSVARLVLRLRAAKVLGDLSAVASLGELVEMLDDDRSRGLPPHLREEAQLALYVEHDPAAALRLARLNFETQRDTPDLRMLAEAAVKAGDAPALEAVRAWMQRSGFEDRVVAAQVKGDSHL